MTVLHWSAAPPPLAIFGSLAISELVLIGAVALMIFGGRLPEVAMRAAAQIMRARKVVARMWREAGLEQELRRVQWDIERKLPRESDFDLRYPSAPQLAGGATRSRSNALAEDHDDDHHDGHGDGHGDGHDAEGGDGALEPSIGFGAPAGTVSVTPIIDRREPDPAPRAPDLPPRDSNDAGGSGAEPAPQSAPKPARGGDAEH
ncbi:MAG: hypothetical protein R3F49_12330 [Planctomycetota bacterium]